MSTELAAAAGVTPQSHVPSAALPPWKTFATLLRRELWEHRYLWLVPLVLAAVMVALAFFGHVQLDIDDADRIRHLDQRVAVMTIIVSALALPFYLVTLVTVTYYLHDCLYSERKDRSILFWKSLPVSDGLTVTSKLVTALVVVPLGTFLVALLATLVVLAIVGVRIAAGNLPALLAWSTGEWLRAEALLLLLQALAALWYAPVAGYILLVSAWARRSPFLWAALPWALAPLLERLAFGTHHVQRFIADRLGGVWWLLAHGRNVSLTSESLQPVGSLLRKLNFAAVLADPGLWCGLGASALFVYGAARLRRYRDDS